VRDTQSSEAGGAIALLEVQHCTMVTHLKIGGLLG
jgi:hypothetical protein